MQIPKYEGGQPKWNFNTLVTAFGVCATVIATAIGWGVNWNTIQNNDEKLTEEIVRIHEKFNAEEAVRRERIADFNSRIRDVQTQLAVIPSLSYGIEQAKAMAIENAQKIEEANKRTDRVVDSFGGKLDTVIDGLNKTVTRVEVLGSKVDDLKRSGGQTSYRMPIVRP